MRPPRDERGFATADPVDNVSRSVSKARLLPVEEALEIVLSHVKPLDVEQMPLLDSLGRVLATDVEAPYDLPPFDRAAMDGYSLRSVDTMAASPPTPTVLETAGTLVAGDTPRISISSGKCVRIMTGVPIPPGADAVVPLELVRVDGSSVSIPAPVKPGADIFPAGEDARKGEVVLRKGTLMRAPEIGFLASIGEMCPTVYRRPSVAIISTGDELVPAEESPPYGKIRNSNAYALAAQVVTYGGLPTILGIARDEISSLTEKIQAGLGYDVILLSGGVSVGDKDLVKEALVEVGTQIVFWKVAMKPGKPLAFGVNNDTVVFGLPGNPAATMLSFEKFVRPALLAMSGRTSWRRPVVTARLAEDIRKSRGRKYFMRAHVWIEGGEFRARTTGSQSSAVLRSMILANGLIVAPEEATFIPAGEMVEVELLDQPEAN
ncbi:MAG: molybdopterin molybdotransferase MoeA [Firmicutes bacterium]|nr:molybdopterin molybdotransferase MoeA [Bacillota bacterium]